MRWWRFCPDAANFPAQGRSKVVLAVIDSAAVLSARVICAVLKAIEEACCRIIALHLKSYLPGV